MTLSRGKALLLLLPAAVVIGLFGAALLDLFSLSVHPNLRPGTPGASAFTLTSYEKVFGDSLYYGSLWVTLRLSVVTTVASLILGMPVAYWIVRTESPRTRAALIILVAIPFMTSLIVRLYALMLVLGNTGLINRTLQALGVIDANGFFPLIRNELSVSIGLTYFVLPFVVFTLAATFRRFDRTLEEAAQSLGADEVTGFFRITLPLLMPGVVGAATLAFVLAGTAFATPLILGGSAVRMIANMIFDQALAVNNLPMAAALAVVAMAFTFVLLYFGNRRTDASRA